MHVSRFSGAGQCDSALIVVEKELLMENTSEHDDMNQPSTRGGRRLCFAPVMLRHLTFTLFSVLLIICSHCDRDIYVPEQILQLR